MFHTSVFSSSIASAAANQQITQVTDSVLPPSGSGFLTHPSVRNIVRVVGAGNLLNKAQLSSPSLKRLTPMDVDPVNVGTLINSPASMYLLDQTPFQLDPDEELDAFITNSGVGATQTSVMVTFADGPIQPISKPDFSVRWTATTTLVVNTWSNCTITFDNGLPSGTYALVGARFMSAGALFGRVVPRGGPVFRPGTVAVQDRNKDPRAFDRHGQMGVWLTFPNTVPPSVDIFSLSADTTEEGIFDLVKIA